MLQPYMLEAHYHLVGGDHSIDALVRNKCEAELLGMLVEVASLIEINPNIIKEAYKEGGFKDIWKLAGKNSQEILIFLMIIQIIISVIPLLDFEGKQLSEEERRLGIEEKKLNIEKLRQEISQGTDVNKVTEVAATSISSNLKIIKRKSNFYSLLDGYKKVEAVGINILNSDFLPVSDEHPVPRSEFRKYRNL